jgi:GMP synthase-like glutamine amidotransferase
MPRVLAFRHVPFEPLGLIADVLTERDIEFEYADLYRNPQPATPDSGSYDGIISMGGPMSANDALPCLAEEIRILQAAANAGKPILGVCLGAQLIAKALGARVYRNRVKEIGWFPVYWTAEAAQDALFGGVPNPETVFHWHGETFDLPPGAQLLAWSDACSHQAYRVGRNIYGLQFHLEVTPRIIAQWCAEDANCGDVRELTEPIDPQANTGRMVELSRSVFGAWCELLGEQRAPAPHAGIARR